MPTETAPTATAARTVAERIAALDWPALTARLDDVGFVQTPPIYRAAECADLASRFDDGRFRSRVDMRSSERRSGPMRSWVHVLSSAA